MPHVTVKLWSGRPDDVKKKLAERLAQVVAEELGSRPGSISVAVEDIAKEDWQEQDYEQEIRNNENLYVTPDY